ncbi:hypothetical protein R6Q59_002706 [Mikania micrantha]
MYYLLMLTRNLMIRKAKKLWLAQLTIEVSIFNLQMEGNYIVEDFSSFINDDVLYTLIVVRIEAMFCDIDNDRDFVTFVDYKQDKIAGIFPKSFLHGYHCSVKVGDVIALVNFKVDRFFYHQFPKYKNYCLIYGDYKIIPTEQTKLIKLANAVSRGFSLYPLIPTIQTLTHDRTRRRLIVDVVGKIVMGERVKYRYSFEIFLQDSTGKIIQLVLYYNPNVDVIRTYIAIKRKMIIYVNNVKLVHLQENNILRSTELTRIVFQPNLPEAHDIKGFVSTFKLTRFLSDDSNLRCMFYVFTKVSVSLWGKLARQHTDDDVRAYGDGNVVVILTSCKVQLFKGEPCLTSTVSSQLYFNLAIPIIETYKSMYVPPQVVFKSHEHQSEDLRVTKIAELFSYLQEGVIEGTMYIIDATIVDVDLVNDWKYVKCSRCRKKTTLNGDCYFCASCDTVVVNPSQAYKLVIRVVDKGEELSCVLFDEAVFSLLGITVDELLTRSFSEVSFHLWTYMVLMIHTGFMTFFFDTLVAQRVILKIKIDRYNLAPNYVRRFTVSKYIGDDVKLLNKDKPMSTACTSQTLTSNYVSDGDVDDTIDDYPPITDDEWAMSDESIWGPHITPLSELTVTNDEHDVSSQGASGNIDADTATPSSSSVGKAKVEEHISPYKLRPKRTIKKPKKLKD